MITAAKKTPAPLHPPVDVVIMAAGKGTRMQSQLPKVLHRLGGESLLHHVVACGQKLAARQAIVITGHGAEQVEASLAQTSSNRVDLSLSFVRQEPQLGTGHAVQQALPSLPDDGTTLVLSGDVPLIQANTLLALLALCDGRQLALLTVKLDDPTGYGRIVRQTNKHVGDPANVCAIVEHKDANAEERSIQEVYSGIMAVPTRLLRGWLQRLDRNNAQGEYYLTDIVKLAVADGLPVTAHAISDATQVRGVNNPVELAELERIYQHRLAHGLMLQGVRLADPGRLDVRGNLRCGQDVEIDVNCVFQGFVTLGDGVQIGANCVIAHAHIEAGTVVHPFTHIDGGQLGVHIGSNAQIGPFARLRPGTQLATDVHVGNFVEIKNATLGQGSKANHLAYVGDATLGEGVNFGAGSITANYDGVNKHRTVIGNDVHVGSNCVLVAPVTLGDGSTVGAGSTITQNTVANTLNLTRAQQTSVPNWKRPSKKPR